MEKERRTKALLLSALVVVVATLSIAFASLSRTLNINGIGKMDTASWSVYFNNLSDAIVNGAEEVGKPNINTYDKGIIENINVKLFKPGDEISYTVDIVNDGTIDAEITMIKDVELTDIQRKVFEFIVTYTETGEKVSDGDTLLADTVKNITIKIRFKDDITEFDLPTENQVINLSYQLTYTQYDGGAIVGPNGGETVTDKPVLATVNVAEALTLSDPSTYHVFNGPIQRRVVESITFLNSDIVPAEYESSSWDASEAKDGSVMAWYEDSNSNGLKEVYIGANGGVAAPADSSGLFAALVSLQQINFNNNFDTTNSVSMYGLFYYVMSIKTLDLSSFNTQNVTVMEGMFSNCSALTSLDLSSFNTTNVTTMSNMFNECSSLVNLNVSSFSTSNVTIMRWMFANCQKLTSLNVSSFNTLNVTDMESMFYKCSSLTSIDVINFNTSNVTNMKDMFSNCSSLTSLNLSTFDTQKVADMSYMFWKCTALTNLDLSNFNTSNVTEMDSMFEQCSSLKNLDLSSFNTSNVTEMDSMFKDCTSLTELKFNNAEFNGVPWIRGKTDPFDWTTNLTVYVKNEAVKNFFEENVYYSNATPGLTFVVEPLNS